MGQNRNKLRNWAMFVLLLLIIVLFICSLTYLSGILSILPDTNTTLATPLIISPIPTIQDTPIARFSNLDPAIGTVLEIAPSNYGNNQVSALSIQPVGIYLPRTGDTQFEIAAPTTLPSPIPYPTSPPLPVPPLAVLPTLVPLTTEAGDTTIRRVLPYTGSECAPSGLPVDGILTQRYHRYHGGIDLGIPSNTPIIATHSGQVIFADWSDIGYGYLVIIQNEQFITYYAHNNSFNVEVGDFVGRGSIIAWSGSTGNSSGPHVHYETRLNDIPVDPLTFETRGYSTC